MVSCDLNAKSQKWNISVNENEKKKKKKKKNGKVFTRLTYICLNDTKKKERKSTNSAIDLYITNQS